MAFLTTSSFLRWRITRTYELWRGDRIIRAVEYCFLSIRGRILSPWLGDMVDNGIGLSTISPSQALGIWAQRAGGGHLMTVCTFASTGIWDWSGLRLLVAHWVAYLVVTDSQVMKTSSHVNILESYPQDADPPPFPLENSFTQSLRWWMDELVTHPW